MKNKNYFKLYTNCIPVKGAKKSIICDLQFNRYIAVPEFYLFIHDKLNKKTIAEIKLHFNNEIDAEIDNLFTTLSSDNWGFYTNEPLSFPKLDLTFHQAGIIANAIIDIDDKSHFDMENIAHQLNELGCRQVQIRFLKTATEAEIQKALIGFKESGVEYIEVLLRNFKSDVLDLKNVVKENLRLRRIILFNQPTNDTINFDEGFIKLGELTKVAGDFKNVCQCGTIHKEYFTSSISVFTEALKFNSCLNKKIAVDARGNIKNCPSMTKTFGNVIDTPLKVALAKKDFIALWQINKDKINVCKDCEFRYICTDCRAYVENPTDLYSKPLKCGYNPYEAKWGKWASDNKKMQTFKEYETNLTA